MVDVMSELHNAIQFTLNTTLIVVHLNALSNYTEAEIATIRQAGGGGRVFVNPVQLPVRWGSVQILQAHLINARYIAHLLWGAGDPGYPKKPVGREGSGGDADPVVVWQASNCRWFRPCMEQYVSRTNCYKYPNASGWASYESIIKGR